MMFSSLGFAGAVAYPLAGPPAMEMIIGENGHADGSDSHGSDEPEASATDSSPSLTLPARLIRRIRGIRVLL